MRKYILPIAAVASISTNPFVQLSTPSSMAIQILEILLGQQGDETSEQLCLHVERRSTASTLPTSVTPLKLNETDPASLLTGSTTTNATGPASGNGTLTDTPFRLCFNALTGLLFRPAFEGSRLILPPSKFMTLTFLAAPTGTTWSGHVLYEELF